MPQFFQMQDIGAIIPELEIAVFGMFLLIFDLLVKTKQAGTTLIVVTHNIPSARVIGDDFAVLQDGRMLATGTIDALDASDEPLVQAFMRAQGGG